MLTPLHTSGRSIMASLATNKSKMNVAIVAIVAGAMALCTFAPPTAAQDAIRVDTNQVVVPVFVFDKDRLYRQLKDPKDVENMFRALLAGDMKLYDALGDGPVIRGLTTADFRLFDDGKEQSVQSVSYERSLFWDVRDNAGHHTEYPGPGGGIWSTGEWPRARPEIGGRLTI
jgi:hypothetical protein